ncbi:MAG: hypothetical protein LWW79_10135 [Holophagaceae bacterium]|nr:hypothetical protein [Holophagaceae bacterium]
MARSTLVLPSLALCLLAVPARAQTAPTFKFSGFGSLAGTSSSEKNADFTSSYSQPNGPGFTRSTDFGVDSRLGVQVDLKFGESFSAVVQAISEHRYDNTYTPYLNMAHLKFKAAPGLSFRAGRMPFSAYLISDYKKVGYAMPWVRPPVEVYQFNPLNYVDGADLVWQASVGDVAFSGQVIGGSTDANLPATTGTSKFKGKSLGAASLSATVGSATFRAFYLQMKSTVDNTYLDGPAGPYALLRAPLIPYPLDPSVLVPNPYYDPAQADQFQIKGDRTTYLSVGFNYDPGDWFVMAEGARNAGDENQLLHATGFYITGGYRFGAWTPYLTFASKKTDSATTNPNPIVEAILSGSQQAQSSTSVGVRWDFRKNLALKAQVDQVKNTTGSPGALVNEQPAFKRGESYNLVTLALDFVF